MHLSTRVFISATSGDLGSVRQAVKEALLAIDCHPVEQTNFPPDYRIVRDMLEEKIRSCQAVVHIVGDRYGAEPDPHKLPPDTPRRSYTQMEYDLARKLNKKLYVFLCATDFPYDTCDVETADKQALQHAHRDALLADERLHTKVATRGELENKVRELQPELQQLRQQVRRYALLVLVVLVLGVIGFGVIGFGVIGYGVYRQSEQISQVQNLYENPDQLAERMRANIRRKADEELQAARVRGAKWEEIRELERRRDVALDQVDELIRTIQQGLAGEPDAIYREASRILAHEGVDAALGYLDSHQQDILARVDRLAAREDAARQKKQQTLEPLLLQANLHATNLAWDRALALYETVAAKAPEWFRARRLLGNILIVLARYSEAEPHLQAALQRAHDDRERSLASTSLGLLYYYTAKWQQAEPLYRRALTITEQAYGAEHPTVAAGLNNLAGLLQATNRLAAAEPLFRRALAIDEQAYGPEHPTVAICLNNLAGLLKVTNRLAAAEPLFRRALAITEQAYGPEHPTVAIRLNNLAGLLQATNRRAAAEPLFRRLAALFHRFGQHTGHEHPFMQTGLENYRRLLNALDVPPEEIERQVRMAMQTPGPLGPITPEVERLLGLVQPVQAVLAALDAQYQQDNKPAVWFLPPDQPIAPHLVELLKPDAEFLNAMGVKAYRNGAHAEAVVLYEESLKRAAGQPEQAPQTFTIHMNRAAALRELGAAEQAHDALQRLLSELNEHAAIPVLTKGRAHYHLALCQWRLGDYAAAQREVEQSLMVYGQVSSQDPGAADMITQSQQLLAALEKNEMPPPLPKVDAAAALENARTRFQAREAVATLPLDQPIVAHLESLLGPARSTKEVLDALDRQYREQGKSPVWFLPPGEPLAPHLDELLGPVEKGNAEKG